MNREQAAVILKTVAGAVETGSYPENISAFDFGMAIARAIYNCNEETPDIEVYNGILHVWRQREAARRLAGDEVISKLIHVPAVLSETFEISRSDARMYIAQGRVRADDELITHFDVPEKLVRDRELTIKKKSDVPTERKSL